MRAASSIYLYYGAGELPLLGSCITQYYSITNSRAEGLAINGLLAGNYIPGKNEYLMH